MTTCTVVPTVVPAVVPSRGQRILETLARWFSHSAASREVVDQAWMDTGLGRLSRATLEDIGASPAAIDAAERREAWNLASSLDATRLM